jgi:methionyl-tRNA formyltransferase
MRGTRRGKISPQKNVLRLLDAPGDCAPAAAEYPVRAMRVLLVGDAVGLPMLLEATPPSAIAALMAASRRAQDLKTLHALARAYDRPLLVQPAHGGAEYDAFMRQFRAYGFDLLVCCSYSMLIRPEMLQAVGGRAVNVHAALLPRNRGPNPIQWAIIRDEPVTGVTLHVMDDGIDTGPVIAQIEDPVRDSDTWVTVSERLHAAMRGLLADQLPDVLAGPVAARRQDEAAATRNPRLTPDSPRIDFATMVDRQIFNLIRAQVHPLRGAFVERDGARTYFRDYLPLEEVAGLRARYA